MATPIETNTQELREVLEQVYNLPDRASGGSSEPDLVIGYREISDTHFGVESADQFSFDPADALNVANKLQRGEPVNCIVNLYYHYVYTGSLVHSTAQMVQVAETFVVESGSFNVDFYYRDLDNMRCMQVNFSPGDDGVYHIQGAVSTIVYSFTSNGWQGF